MKRRTLLQCLGGGIASSFAPVRLFAQPAAGMVTSTTATSTIMGATAWPPHEGTSLNLGWRFHLGDIVPPPLREQSATYVAAKAGGARGAAAMNYNDDDWRSVDLPHDWAIEAPPMPTENIAQGYRKRGYGWYRRSLNLDPALTGRYLEIQFGAIASNATVWFNGTPVAHNWSGYNGFYIDISSMATFGGKPNILSVRVDAEKAEGWWYEGAGIYRDVWLVDRAPVSIATDGVYAHPRRRADGRWHIPVEVNVYSIEKDAVPVTFTAELLDSSGAVIATTGGGGNAQPLELCTLHAEIDDFQPRLWSLEQPVRYSVRTRVLRDGRVVDERLTPCGFRTLRFDGQEGFFFNDTHTKIKGVCVHQDHAGVGVAVPPALVEWRVRQLKAMGCNAIRCAHGAPDAVLLDVCDRVGMLVMDENRNFNVSPDYLEQLRWLVRRDRNRPCVFMWSVFNEEPLQGTPAGYEMVRRAVATVKELDDTRPATAAMSNGMFTPMNVSQAVNVVGFNYQHTSYDRFHQQHPDLPMLSSEDTSGFITRGAWAKDKERKIHSSDDSDAASWGLTQRAAWKAIDTRPYLAGGFAWSAFDYHGEPTPERWPANSSYFGILDLCGFPKSAFFLRRAMWVKDRPLLDILPHWNWEGREGHPVEVLLATNVERVELWCNGRKVGEGNPDPYDMIAFEVPYQPGVLEARGWRNGRQVITSKVETTGAAVKLRLTPDRMELAGDGVDAQPITIEALDAKGRAVPFADHVINLAVEGGRIIGVGNGDPTSVAPSKGNQVRLFNGLAQVIVQSERGSAGKLTLTTTAEGVRPAAGVIRIRRAEIRQLLPHSIQQLVSLWRQSPVVRERPKVIPNLADNDMNSWDQVIAGERPAAAASDGYVMIVTRVTLSGPMTEFGAVLKFGGISGSGEVLVNDASAARKNDAQPGGLDVELAPGAREATIGVVLRSVAGEPVGLSGPVFVEARRSAR